MADDSSRRVKARRSPSTAPNTNQQQFDGDTKTNKAQQPLSSEAVSTKKTDDVDDDDDSDDDLDALRALVLKSATVRQLQGATSQQPLDSNKAGDASYSAMSVFSSLANQHAQTSSDVDASTTPSAVNAWLTRATLAPVVPTLSASTRKSIAPRSFGGVYVSALQAFRSYLFSSSFDFGTNSAPPSSLTFINRITPLTPLCRYDLHGVCK